MSRGRWIGRKAESPVWYCSTSKIGHWEQVALRRRPSLILQLLEKNQPVMLSEAKHLFRVTLAFGDAKNS
jgi:hypothetical protein